MPTWKKVVVSGSGVSQLANDVNYLIDGQENAILSGSFTGSFKGDGSGLTGIASQLSFSGTSGTDTLNLKTETLTINGSDGIATSVTDNTITVSAAGLSGSAHTQRVAISGSFASSQAAQDGRLASIENFTASLNNTFATDAELSTLSGSAHTQRVAEASVASGLVNTLSGSAHTDRVAKVSALSGSAHTQRGALVSGLSTDISNLSGSAHTQRVAEAVVAAGLVSSLSGSAHAQRVVEAGVASGLVSSLSGSAHAQRVVEAGAAAGLVSSLSGSSATALRAEYVAADTALSSSIATTISNLSSTISISGSTGNADVNLVTDDLSIVGVAGQTETTVTGTTVSIGFVTNPTVSGNLLVTGDLTVTGNTFEAQVTNLNVEDRFILLNSGSNSGDAGIIFGGSDGTANVGSGIFFDNPAAVFGFAQGIGSADTTATHQSKLGNIEVSAATPSAQPTFQGVGTIHVDSSTGELYIYS